MNINSYLQLLPGQYRRRTVQMAFLGVLRKLLDLIGLATLLPLIVVIIAPSSVEGDSVMAKLFQFIGLDTIAGFGLVLGISALVLLPLKSMLTIWLGNVQNSFLLEIYRYYSKQLYNYYHSKGLLFIRRTFSSQLAFHINGACYGFAMSIIGTILNAASELIITLALAAIVVWFAPMASLMLFAAMIPVLIIYFAVVKNKLKILGQQAYDARRAQTQIVQESLKGHISLNINNSFGNVSKEFEQGLNTISKLDLKNTVYKQIPSVILQICVAITLIILLIEGVTNGTSTTLFILFGFVAVRIMPSILSLANSWNILQNSQYIIDIIGEANQFSEESKPDDNIVPMSFCQQIELRDITFAFEGGMPIFSNFSIKIQKGESVGFRGASGVGKSTLFNLFLGFYIPQHGGVYIDGERLSPHNRRNWHKIAGYVEQEIFIKNDTLANNLCMSASEPDNAKMIKVLEQVGLSQWFKKLNDGLETVIGEAGSTISGGERQRIGIARALYKDPQILFIDESTSALDSKTEEDIVSLLHRLSGDDLTLLIISHRESALRYCDRVIEV